MAEESFLDSPFAAAGAFGGIEALVAETAAVIGKEMAAAGGGKYSFSPDELRAVLTKWQNLSQTVSQAQMAAANNSMNITLGGDSGGGNEVASQHASGAVTKTQDAYSQYLDSMQKYVTGYVQKLNDALTRYTGVEHNAASAAHRISGGMAS